MEGIIQIVGLVSGRKYSPSQSTVFKYCEASKDYFLDNLEMEITTVFEAKCSVGLEGQEKDVWLSNNLVPPQG